MLWVPTALGLTSVLPALCYTRCLGNILDAAVLTCGKVLEPFIQQLLNAMHLVLCKPVDYSDSMAIKNYNEAMRSMETVGRAYTDAIVIFVLQRIEAADASIRAGSFAAQQYIVMAYIAGSFAAQQSLKARG